MAQPRKRMPPLPKALFSVLGPVPIEMAPDLDGGDALGVFDERTRKILIERDMPKTTQWSTLLHELCHLALWDGGLVGRISNEQEEAICDAIGNYLAASLYAGHLLVKGSDATVSA